MAFAAFEALYSINSSNRPTLLDFTFAKNTSTTNPFPFETIRDYTYYYCFKSTSYYFITITIITAADTANWGITTSSKD